MKDDSGADMMAGTMKEARRKRRERRGGRRDIILARRRRAAGAQFGNPPPHFPIPTLPLFSAFHHLVHAADAHRDGPTLMRSRSVREVAVVCSVGAGTGHRRGHTADVVRSELDTIIRQHI